MFATCLSKSSSVPSGQSCCVRWEQPLGPTAGSGSGPGPDGSFQGDLHTSPLHGHVPNLSCRVGWNSFSAGRKKRHQLEKTTQLLSSESVSITTRQHCGPISLCCVTPWFDQSWFNSISLAGNSHVPNDTQPMECQVPWPQELCGEGEGE